MLRLGGFAAVRKFPNRQLTLKNPAPSHGALKHQSDDFRRMQRARCASAPKQADGVFKVGVFHGAHAGPVQEIADDMAPKPLSSAS